MWRKNRTYFFCGLNLEQVLAYWKIWRKKSHLFGGMNLEQVLAYWKIWRKNSHFFLAVWTWNRCWPSWQKLWRERDRDCWLQSIDGNEGLAGFFFGTFSHLFHLFHIIFFFFIFFYLSFFAFFFALSLTWPRPQPCRLSLPSLNVPHTTSPLLSFLNTILKKRSIEIFSRFLCWEVLAHQEGWSFQGLSICPVVDVGYKLSFQMYHVCDVCVVKARS